MTKIGRTIAVGLLAALLTNGALAQQFEGTFEFRWLPDKNGSHREMLLLSDVAFVDAEGDRWPVPAGERTDGASIPALLWSFAGTPFTGKYRRAAVIHDYYCRIGTYPASEVHGVFREGMLADGTDWVEAQSKYAAVVVYDSMVSIRGEGCGVESRPFDELNGMAPASFDQDVGAVISDEVLATIQQYEVASLSELPLEARVNQLIDLARIERRKTYESLVQFGALPSRDTYHAIEVAIAMEEPDEVQLDVLIQLARGTFPVSQGMAAVSWRARTYSSQTVSKAPAS
jgi:hypothetical protein